MWEFSRFLALVLFVLTACSQPNKPAAITELSVISQFPVRGMPNPRKISTAADWVISTHLWSRLVQLGELGHETPDLAKGWVRSLDGLKWIFEFDETLKWSDGSRLTTAQIADSLNLSIHGTAHTNLKSYVKKVYAADATHVVFELKALPQNFLYSLSFADFAVTDGNIPENGNPPQADSIRFSGPYKLAGAGSNAVTMEPNPHAKLAPKVKVTARILGASSADEFAKSLLENRARIGFISSDVIPDDLEDRLLESGYKEHVTSPEWTISLEAGKSGLKRFSAANLRWIQKQLWSRLGQSKNFGNLAATGLRPPFSYGGLSELEWKNLLASSPDKPSKSAPKSLDLMVRKVFLQSKSYVAIRSTLRDLGFTVSEIAYDPQQPGSAAMKRLESQDYDFWFVYEGVNDPDPDSAWRYMMESYPGSKKLVSKEELDRALLEPDRKKREAMYKEFEKRNVENPYILPIRMVGSKVFIKPPVLPPEEGQFEWGIQLWKFRLK